MESMIFNIQRFSLHDGPGIRTTVFYKGCPLRCTWCSNPESQKPVAEPMWDKLRNEFVTTGYKIDNDKLVEEVLKDEAFYEESGGGVTVSGGEVLYQVDAAVDFLTKCKAKGIHTACETSAFAPEKDFRKLMDVVDFFIMDVKHHDTDMHMKGTRVPLQPILDNLKILIASDKKKLIRIPIIPDFNNSLDDAKAFAKLLTEYNVKQVELLPFHQFGAEKYKQLDREYAYEDVKNLSRDDLLDYIDIIADAGIDVICN